MTGTERNVAVVVGANGGVGRALTAALRLDRQYAHVVGLSRTRPADMADDERQTWLAANILDASSLAAAAKRVEELGAPTRVIVATGLLHGPDVAPAKSLRALCAQAMPRVFQVNTIGPALVAQHFLPLTPRDRLADRCTTGLTARRQQYARARERRETRTVRARGIRKREDVPPPRAIGAKVTRP